MFTTFFRTFIFLFPWNIHYDLFKLTVSDTIVYHFSISTFIKEKTQVHVVKSLYQFSFPFYSFLQSTKYKLIITRIWCGAFSRHCTNWHNTSLDRVLLLTLIFMTENFYWFLLMKLFYRLSWLLIILTQKMETSGYQYIVYEYKIYKLYNKSR